MISQISGEGAPVIQLNPVKIEEDHFYKVFSETKAWRRESYDFHTTKFDFSPLFSDKIQYVVQYPIAYPLYP